MRKWPLQRRAGTRMAVLFCLAVSPAAWSSNPIPADGLSLLNGAEYFKRFCTECHGWDPDEQYTSLYSEDPFDVPDPLLEPELPEEPFVEEPEDDWPEWAGPAPQAPAQREPDVQSQVLSDLNAAIDDVYREGDERFGAAVSGTGEPAYSDLPDGTGRVQGATDLTNPLAYIYGTSENDLFDQIAHGTGPTMPGFLDALGSEEAVWDLVNYIRSLWGDDWLD